MRTKSFAAAAVLAAAISLIATTALAAPGLSITSPAAGTTVSRSASPQITITGNVSFDAPSAIQEQYFLRHAPCSNASSDERYLSTTTSNSDAQACGYNGTITPLNEIGHVSGQMPPAREAYPMEEAGLPLTLDATRPITGVLDVASFNASGVGTGVGATSVDFVLRGTVDGTVQTLGTQTVSYQQTPGAVHKEVAFSISPAATFDKKDLTTFEFEYTVRGVNALHGYVYYRGLSHLTIPKYTASFNRKVEIAVDAGSFSASAVTLSPDLSSFTATIPTPGVGIHSIKARAVQGGATSAVDQRSITVTA